MLRLNRPQPFKSRGVIIVNDSAQLFGCVNGTISNKIDDL